MESEKPGEDEKPRKEENTQQQKKENTQQKQPSHNKPFKHTKLQLTPIDKDLQENAIPSEQMVRQGQGLMVEVKQTGEEENTQQQEEENTQQQQPSNNKPFKHTKLNQTPIEKDKLENAIPSEQMMRQGKGFIEEEKQEDENVQKKESQQVQKESKAPSKLQTLDLQLKQIDQHIKAKRYELSKLMKQKNDLELEKEYLDFQENVLWQKMKHSYHRICYDGNVKNQAQEICMTQQCETHVETKFNPAEGTCLICAKEQQICAWCQKSLHEEVQQNEQNKPKPDEDKMEIEEKPKDKKTCVIK